MALDWAGAGRVPAWRVWSDPEQRYFPIRAVSTGPAAPPERPDSALPTVALAVTERSLQWVPGAPWHQWLATMWPGNIEPVLAVALDHLILSLDGSNDMGAGDHALDLLTRTVAELPPLSPYVIAAGLGRSRLGERTVAVDAAAALLPSRVSPEAVAAAMVTLAPAVPLNRWANALGDLAAAGRGAEVRAILAALLPSLNRTLRDWLAAVTGGSKTATAARELLRRAQAGR